MSRENQADYLAIAPAEFEDALAPLLDHRTGDGLNVALITTDAINKEFGMHVEGADRIEAFVRYAYFQWKKPAPEYLLIVGDAAPPGATETTGLEVPTNLLQSIYKGNRDRGGLIASDVAYGDVDADGAPDIATGRIPATGPDELSAIIEKIIRYETWPPAGLWKRRLTFFASVGDFGAIDKMIEKMYKSMIKGNIGPEFDINMTYANPKMPYLFVPSRFNEKVIERYNDGSIMMLYIGHGFTRGFDVVEWKDKQYPI
ncbi:MAG: hypothetical protein KAG97_13825, partial [Victivallales bacterium]|nr:hypothetical protein [Victivallales bacterium]